MARRARGPAMAKDDDRPVPPRVIANDNMAPMNPPMPTPR